MNSRADARVTVVKLGGSLLAHRAQLDLALRTIEGEARLAPLVVVPGGGPFADAVRALDHELALGDDAAHWMAVLAMEQYAHALVHWLASATLVAGPDEIRAALAAGRVPVLAPYAWLRVADPLPHSWAVTSDSIAAWVAAALGARHIVLVKAPGAAGDGLVDANFATTLAPGTTHDIVAADAAAGLRAALRGRD